MYNNVREMNPRVDLKVISENIQEIVSKDFLKDYNVVCCSGLAFKDAVFDR